MLFCFQCLNDASGNIYLTGNFLGKIGFDNITLTSTKNGSTYTGDIFIVKMSSTGAVLWAKSAGTGNDGCNTGETAGSITTDNAGNVYITGRIVYKVFKNTTVCNEIPSPGCTNATIKSITAPYLVKYNSAGIKIWEKLYGNSQALASTSCWYNHPSGLDVSTDGLNIYSTGYFYGTVTFGNATLSTGSETTSNQYLLKLDGNGNTIWGRSVTGASNGGYGVGHGLLVDGNDIYFRGLFNPGIISFGGCSLTNSGSYLAKYSSAGTCQWANIQLGIPYGIVKLMNGNLAVLLRRSWSLTQWYDTKELSPLDGSTIDSVNAATEDTATASVNGYPNIVALPDGFIFTQQLAGTYHFGSLVITSTYPKGGSRDMIIIRYTYAAPPMAGRSEKTSPSFDKLYAYPNPVVEQLTISNKDNKMLGLISIYDGSGKLIYKNFVRSYQVTVDLKNFPVGLYYLKSDHLQAAINFVKQ